jgi:hypothetical protein
MSARDSEIDALDHRHPIAMTHAIPTFGNLLADWLDNDTVIAMTQQATAQAMRREERYVTPAPPAAPQPRWVPEEHHDDPEDTRADWGWVDAGGDRFVREGQVKPENTDRIAVIHDEAEREAVRCTCGHERDAHQHYRRGTPCAQCGCARWRPRRWWRVLGHRAIGGTP